jgi:hypothetical protein
MAGGWVLIDFEFYLLQLDKGHTVDGVVFLGRRRVISFDQKARK